MFLKGPYKKGFWYVKVNLASFKLWLSFGCRGQLRLATSVTQRD